MQREQQEPLAQLEQLEQLEPPEQREQQEPLAQLEQLEPQVPLVILAPQVLGQPEILVPLDLQEPRV